ncbi:MAG: ATP synthase F1 subunit epsilon [Actinomycetia bacterium]|nr:ATP synthase F1 subunit epsilon [Actinomycetes bacterium]
MAEDRINVSIVTPEEVVFEGKVNYLGVPSVKGSMGILAGHMPVVCQLDVGIIKLKSELEEKYVAVQKGYMEFFNNNANILTGRAIKTTYQDRHKAIEEVSKRHDIVQEISEETKKVIQAIGTLKRLRK